MRRIFEVLLATGFYTASLCGHSVVYRSPAGTFRDDTESPSLKTPFAVTLTFGTEDGSITVQHYPGEHCVVSASITVPASGDPLVQVLANSGKTAAGTGLDVEFLIHILRNAHDPAESVTLSGSWKATGDLDTGGSDPKNCNGSGAILADLVVQRVNLPATKTAANLPASAHTDDPIWTNTGEVSHADRDDLVLGGPLPLRFVRYYASMLSSNGVVSALGNNWMHNFDLKLAVSASNATVTLFRGQTVAFKQSGGAWQLANAERANYQLISSGGGFRFLDPSQNLIYTFSSSGALTRIEDRAGNALTVTPGPSGPVSVSDGLGRALTFSYAGGRLASVSDQTGRRVSFSYTGSDLTLVTDAVGRNSTYTYATAGSQVGLLVSKTLPAGNKPYTQTFDASGRAIGQIDSFNNSTALSYNASSPGVTTITDPLNRSTRHMYQNASNLMTSTDAAGQSSTFNYDGASRPTSVTDRMGSKTATTYDAASGYISTITDAQGNSTTFTYTAQPQGGFTFYNLSRITFADGTSASFTYDATGNILTITDRVGKRRAFTYNSAGQVLTASNAVGGVTVYMYNNDGTLLSVKTPAGDVTSYSYDDKKRPVKIQAADNTSRSFTWDAADNMLAITDERGKTTSLAYDPNNNLKSATDALNQSTLYSYDTDDLLSVVTDALGRATRFEYDPTGSLTAITNPAGEKMSFTYDALNRPKSIADASGKGPSFTYDAEGRLSAVTDALSNTTRFTVDKLGRTTRIATPLGENSDYTYDALGRVTSSTNPLSQKTTYGLDSRGLLTAVTLPGAIGASYARDDLGAVTNITDPNGNAWKRAYDSMGRLKSRTDPLGRVTNYSYDTRNRVSSIASPAGTLAFTYDAAGNQVRGLYSDGTDLKFTFDDDNHPTGSSGVQIGYDAAGWISQSNGLAITRDAVGRIVSIAYPPGAVTYTYNERGLLGSVSDWAGGGVTMSYNDAGDLVSTSRSNGTTAQFTYDKDRRLAGITETGGGGDTLLSIALQRDAAGRMVSADRNLPQSPAVAPGVSPAGYDAAHQLTGATYDGAGKVINDGLRSYTWDLAGRLLSYSGADGAASFTYDGFRQRISRAGADGTTQNYVINYATGLPSVATVQSGGADLRYYVYLPDGSLLYSIEAADGAHRYYSFDEAGSTTMLTGDDGGIVDAYGITPYGETVTQLATSDNPFTFQGRRGVMQEPGTSLYYMRFRYYDSAPARFLSRDPVQSLDPQQINPYQYAAGNPLLLIDPMGLKAQSPLTPQVTAPPLKRMPVAPYQPLVITDSILLNEQATASQDFNSRWWNPLTIITFDSPTFHGGQTRGAIVGGKAVAVQNQVNFHGRIMDYGEFNYYYTATYYSELGVPRGVQVLGTYLYNIFTKGQLPTDNQILASNEGYWDNKQYHSMSRAPVDRTVIDLTPAKEVVNSVADTVGNFILDHPVINDFLSWFDN